jgi:predicted RNase H-like HicB family nuclease
MSEIKELGLIIHHAGDHLWAEVEEYPGCFATGQDLAELTEALEEAISMYLADSERDRRRVIVEIMPEQPRRKQRRPARVELTAA